MNEHKYMGHETSNWGGRGLGYMLFNEYLLEHLKIKMRLIDERFASVMGECVIVKL
jgi:hypothetical protein